MLRSPRSGRLEARRLPMQPAAPRRCPSEPGHDRGCRSRHRANAARYRGRSNRGVAPGGGAGIAREAAEAAARRAIGDAAIDVLVQPPAGRRKRVLVADLEATIIENEMLDELADFIGRRSEVAEITRRAMNGEIDFVGALEERVALLKGLPASV